LRSNYNKDSKLAVVWTSGDPDVAHRVCFLYCHNDIVLRAHRLQISVIVEYLDFDAKKREWKSAGYNRMLSSFAYHQFHAMVRSTAATLGVEVIAINPRNTTTIGIVAILACTGIIW